MKKKNILIFIVLFILILITCIGVWWHEKYITEKLEHKFSSEITFLRLKYKNCLDLYQELGWTLTIEEGARLKSCRKTLDDLIAENYYLRLISPNGGETLCLGEDFTIIWETKGVSRVELYIGDGKQTEFIGNTSAINIETGECNKGFFTWEAGKIDGKILQEGYTYKILIKSGDSSGWSKVQKDESEYPFQILLCKG